MVFYLKINVLKRKIVTTSDGSKTIKIEDWNEHYHSKHGAINEANHVFLKHGLLFFCNTYQNNNIKLLEIGFGTGLNAFLTLIQVEKLNLCIKYTGIEAYPIKDNEINELNYPNLISEAHTKYFNKMHNASWNKLHNITPNFSFKKENIRFETISYKNAFNIIYFDAFGARVQPELWTEFIFKIMYNALMINGILVTYSAKGSVRRAMQKVGFIVERLSGPPGKREMLRATKC